MGKGLIYICVRGDISDASAATGLRTVAGDDSASDVAAAESAVKKAKQGKGKASPEDIVNALAAAEEQHKKLQAVGMAQTVLMFTVYTTGVS